jgi:hypothetical protein
MGTEAGARESGGAGVGTGIAPAAAPRVVNGTAATAAGAGAGAASLTEPNSAAAGSSVEQPATPRLVATECNSGRPGMGAAATVTGEGGETWDPSGGAGSDLDQALLAAESALVNSDAEVQNSGGCATATERASKPTRSSEWRMVKSRSTGKPYYYNVRTKESLYHKPLDFDEPVPVDAADRCVRGALWPSTIDVVGVLWPANEANFFSCLPRPTNVS